MNKGIMAGVFGVVFFFFLVIFPFLLDSVRPRINGNEFLLIYLGTLIPSVTLFIWSVARALRSWMATRAPSTRYAQPPPVTAKEVIKEKEVIVKVRCKYSNTLFDETLDECPHCGAKR